MSESTFLTPIINIRVWIPTVCFMPILLALWKEKEGKRERRRKRGRERRKGGRGGSRRDVRIVPAY